jgi:hypothetical protein
MYPGQELSPTDAIASPGISAGAMSIPLSSGSILPSSGYPLLVAIGTSDGFDETTELVLVTAGTSTLTVSARGVNGTTAKAWDAGSLVAINFTALQYWNLVLNLQACQLTLQVGTATNVQDGVAVSYSPGGTPRALILQGVSPGNDGTQYNLPPTLQSFNSTQFIANIKTNTGDPGNPMTVTWIAVM